MTKRTALAIAGESYVSDLIYSHIFGSVTCPGSKLQNMPEDTCAAVFLGSKSRFWIFDFSFLVSSSTEHDHPEQSPHLQDWVRYIFEKYDFRYAFDSTFRVPVPADGDLNWDYGLLRMTGETALELANESIISRLWFESRLPTTNILAGKKAGRTLEKPRGDRFFDSKGKTWKARVSERKTGIFSR